MDNNALSQQPYLTFFDEGTAEYDVIVDQSSSAPNLKEATWGALQPLLPLVADRLGPEEFALILEYSPLPESFIEKFQGIADQKAQQPPPPDPEMMKIEAMKQAKSAELEMRQQEVAVDMQLEQQKTAAQLQLEQQKAIAQIELERQKLASQIELEREKMDADKMGKIESMRLDTAMNFKDDPEKLSDMLHDKKLTSAIEQMTQALTSLAVAQAQMVQMQAASNEKIADSVAGMGAELRNALTKPKQIVRGPDGRAIGVK